MTLESQHVDAVFAHINLVFALQGQRAAVQSGLADVFFIQYNGEIDERVIEEARQKTTSLRAQGQHHAVFSIVDGLDPARLIAAFP